MIRFRFPKNAMKALGLLVPGILLAGCMGSNSEPGLNYGTVLNDLSENVIFATYTDLDAKAHNLQDSIGFIDTNSINFNGQLVRARNAWREARQPWEQGEAFFFGPVEDSAVDGSVDTSPIDKVALDVILHDTTTITRGYLNTLPENLKGFHVIEFLLFGDDDNRTDISMREMDFLKAATANFVARVDTLKNAWDPAHGNYEAQVKTAGSGSRVFPTQRSAASQLLNAMIGICDEVSGNKLSTPLLAGHENDNESHFSHNSTADFANNLFSVRNVYTGVYLGQDGTTRTGAGLQFLVHQRDPVLADSVLINIDKAIAAINNMGTFETALVSNRDQVLLARTLVLKVKTQLSVDVKNLLFP